MATNNADGLWQPSGDPTYANSLDKIVQGYIAAIIREPITYTRALKIRTKRVTLKPKPLKVLPSLFKGATCPPSCGACCIKFSLDWLPSDPRPDDNQTVMNEVVVNNKSFAIFTDKQKGNEGHFCRHLDIMSGRCGIHGKHPYACDFEVIKFLHPFNSGHYTLTSRLFGRA